RATTSAFRLPLALERVEEAALGERGLSRRGRRRGSSRTEKPMSDEEMKAELSRLRAENEALKSRNQRGVSLRVSEKGGVSVYGLGRFPVTLYKEQWLRLLEMAEDIRTFIRENEPKLKTKE